MEQDCFYIQNISCKREGFLSISFTDVTQGSRTVSGTEQTLITYLLPIAQDGPNTLYVKTNNELQILKEHKVEVQVHLEMITDLALNLHKLTDIVSKSKLTMYTRIK